MDGILSRMADMKKEPDNGQLPVSLGLPGLLQRTLGRAAGLHAVAVLARS